MKLPDPLLRLMFRPRVRHSLPGRLRVEFPFVRRLTVRRREIVDLVIELIGLPPEIRAVRGSTVSGSLLIEYDPAHAGEADVLAYLDALLEIYLANRAMLDGLNDARWAAARAKLIDRVRGALRPRLVLDERLEIAADVLA